MCGPDPGRADVFFAGTEDAGAIQVPPGFAAVLYFSGLEHPTSMAVGPDGRLYVAQQDGEIVSIADEDGNGVGDQKIVYATGLELQLGITFVGEDLYVSHRGNGLKVSFGTCEAVRRRLPRIREGDFRGGFVHRRLSSCAQVAVKIAVNRGLGARPRAMPSPPQLK